MLKYLTFLLFAMAMTSCNDHPYQTDGHNSVQLPSALDEELPKDSIPEDFTNSNASEE